MWLLTTVTALAGTLVFNGVEVEGSDLANMTFEQVEIRFDAMGVPHVTAPGYEVEFVEPRANPSQLGGRRTGTNLDAAMMEPVASPREPVPARPEGRVAQHSIGPRPANPWWLILEDGGAMGQRVHVWVNEHLAAEIMSGDTATAVEVSHLMTPGVNDVRVESESGGNGGAGIAVHLGPGQQDGGVVFVNDVRLQHTVSGTPSGRSEWEFTIQVED